jgi:molybdenum cofactor guanylyltransferase
MARVLGVVLAGGKGSRLGGADKALIRLAGITLLDHAVARLSPQVDALVISANGDAARFGVSVPVLADSVSLGPLSGVLAALRHAERHGFDAVVSVAVDTPFFPADLVARLAAPGGPAIAARGGRVHPTFGFWPVTVTVALARALAEGRAKVTEFAEAVGAQVVAFAGVADADPFRNLNTPEDLAQVGAVLPPGQGAERR